MILVYTRCEGCGVRAVTPMDWRPEHTWSCPRCGWIERITAIEPVVIEDDRARLPNV